MAYKAKRALTIVGTGLQAEAVDAFEARRAVSTIATGGDADAVVAGKPIGARVFFITDNLRYADTVDADSARRAITGFGALQEADISAVVSRGADISRWAGIVIGRIAYLDACTIEAFVSFWAGVILITLGEWIACTIPAGVTVGTREVIVTSNQANMQSAFQLGANKSRWAGVVAVRIALLDADTVQADMSGRAVAVFATSRDGAANTADTCVTIRARSVSITLEPATAVDTSEAIWATIVVGEDIEVACGAADAVDANPISRATTISAILTEEWRQADSEVALISRRTICCFARGEAMIAEASEARRAYRIVWI